MITSYQTAEVGEVVDEPEVEAVPLHRIPGHLVPEEEWI